MKPEFEVIHKNVIGLDVHQKFITACALMTDSQGTVVHQFKEFGTFKNDLRSLAAWAAEVAPDAVVMESTGVYWKSPYSALSRAGLKVLVVNARHVKNVPGRKTDISDSLWLAMLGRAGLLRGSFIPPADLDALRLLAHQRVKIKSMLASEKNRFGKVLVDAGARLSVVVSDVHGQAARRMTECLLAGGSLEQALSLAGNRLKASPEELRFALDAEFTPTHLFILNEIMDHMKDLEDRIHRFDEELIRGLSSYRWALEILQTVPGLDTLSAAMLLVEIGVNMDVFGSAAHLASWAGLCPGNNETAGKNKGGKMRKGNRYVRRILCEAAHAAKTTTSQFKGKFLSLVSSRGYKRAIIALAHKLLRIIYTLLRNREAYRDPSVDYEALLIKRKAPRWIAALKRYNLLPQTV